MAITKSAKKAIRQSARHRAHNLVYKNKIKNLIKKMRILVSQKKIEQAKDILPQIYKILDKAVKKKGYKKECCFKKKARQMPGFCRDKSPAFVTINQKDEVFFALV